MRQQAAVRPFLLEIVSSNLPKEEVVLKTVLALVPHPDDAEFYAGGLLAWLIDEGHCVRIAVATDGRCGSFEQGGEALAALRAEEMRRAAAVLGAEPPILLGYPDMGLDQLPPGVLRERLLRLIRQHRPDIVVTEDPFALYDLHPDHRAVAWAAAEAINASDLPTIHPEHLAEGLAPHFVPEKYFYGEHLPGANKIIDTTDYLPRKLAALAEHRSQVGFLVEGVLREARLAGLDLATTFGPAANDPLALLAWGIGAQDAAVGQRIGARYAEAFRYVRYHPLVEAALAG